MDADDHIVMAALEAVNEIWGYEQVAPEDELERLQSILEAAFWDAWKGAQEGSA